MKVETYLIIRLLISFARFVVEDLLLFHVDEELRPVREPPKPRKVRHHCDAYTVLSSAPRAHTAIPKMASGSVANQRTTAAAAATATAATTTTEQSSTRVEWWSGMRVLED